MKVKCIQLIEANGQNVDFLSWLAVGRVYHVTSITTGKNGKSRYGIISGDLHATWPEMSTHPAECFTVISNMIPSNWRKWMKYNGHGSSPAAWQVPGFHEAFYDHDWTVCAIFQREFQIILQEDP